MSIKWYCDRCGRQITNRVERVRLVVEELDVSCDLCAECAHSLRAWVRRESADPRSMTS